VTSATARRGPVNALTDEKGRFYEHPITGERFISVTTCLKSVAKDSLIFWAAGLAAEAALDELPRLIAATLRKPCERTFNRCEHDFRMRCSECPCDTCPTCVAKWLRDRHIAESSRRADEGTRAHDVIEHWVLNDGQVRDHDEDVAPFVRQFLAFVVDHGLTPRSWEMSEATVINREHEYAGTLDQLVRFKSSDSAAAAELCARLGKDEVLLLGDSKTRGKPTAAFYPEYALQCAAYRSCTHVLLPDGREEPLPEVDGAFVLQLRPDGYELRLVVADDSTFWAFLAVLSLARWQMQHATASVSTRSFPKPKPEPVAKPVAKATAKRVPVKKAASRRAARDPDGESPPSRPVRQVAAQQSATLASMTGGWPAKQPVPEAHPDSPYHDRIPF
jgi:hypothetical protein